MSTNNNETTRTLVGNMLLAQDEQGNNGNLIVEGTLTTPTLITQSLIVASYTTQITITDQTTLTINHNINTSAPKVIITDNSGNYIIAGLTITNPNTLTINISSGALASGTILNINIWK